MSRFWVCRAVVHKGELPVDGNEEKDATQAADGATAVPKDPNMLPTTPSLLEAAAAGEAQHALLACLMQQQSVPIFQALCIS